MRIYNISDPNYLSNLAPTKDFKWIREKETMFGHIKTEGTTKMNTVCTRVKEIIQRGFVRLQIDIPKGWKVEKYDEESNLLENKTVYLGECKFYPKYVSYSVNLAVGESAVVMKQTRDKEIFMATIDCVNKSKGAALLAMESRKSYSES